MHNHVNMCLLLFLYFSSSYRSRFNDVSTPDLCRYLILISYLIAIRSSITTVCVNHYRLRLCLKSESCLIWIRSLIAVHLRGTASVNNHDRASEISSQIAAVVTSQISDLPSDLLLLLHHRSGSSDRPLPPLIVLLVGLSQIGAVDRPRRLPRSLIHSLIR